MRNIEALLGTSASTTRAAKPATTRLPLSTVVATTLVVVAAAGAAWFFWSDADTDPADWIEHEALPAVESATAADDFVTAYQLAEKIESIDPAHPALESIFAQTAATGSLQSFPPGAEVAYRRHDDPDASWHIVGTTPQEDVRHPTWILRWRATLEDREPLELVSVAPSVSFVFPEQGPGEKTVYIPSYELQRDSSGQVLNESIQLPDS